MSMTDNPPIDESEWAAQERGMRAVLAQDATGMDAATMDYSVIARALVTAPHGEPPNGFADDVAKRITRRGARVERLLSRTLLAAFVLTSIIVCVQYGGQWWRPLHRSFGDEALQWMLVATACAALSWTSRQLLELAAQAPGRVSGTNSR